MMKVRVHYTKVVEEIIEVDSKFNQLTDSGGYENLSYEERESLESQLMEEACSKIDTCWTEICGAYNAENDELMFEV